MITKQTLKKVIATTAIASLLIPCVSPELSEAAAKPKLSKKKVQVSVGSSKTIKVKKANGAKITWKSKNKKIAAVKKSGKYGAKITGKKKGSTKIVCKVKKGKKTRSLSCTVKVSKKSVREPKATDTPQNTQAPPTSTPAGGTGTVVQPPAPTAAAPATITPSPEPTVPADATILGSYEKIFGKVGTCLTCSATNTGGQMQDAKIMEHVQKNYNSFTLENEMKPDAILGGDVSELTVDEAKELGYEIPDNYTETTVPELHFQKLDNALKIANEKGLKMRAHTLVWHSQTPGWFFAIDYDDSDDPVTPEVMDARLEFYVRSVMKHVMEKEKELNGEAGSIVYAWDVVNEYLHRSKPWNGYFWDSVYGDQKLKPAYVKKAFQVAYDMLKSYQVQDKVVLFNNDYDTYFGVENELAIVNFINEGEETNICGGIGMQSHVDIKRPTIEEYETALKAFLNTGLEVQITELDMTINFNSDGANPSYGYKDEGETLEEQAVFVKDFMEMVVTTQKNRDKTVSPKGITGLTLWGICDANSWRSKMQPLLFGTSIEDKKEAFNSFIKASWVWE